MSTTCSTCVDGARRARNIHTDVIAKSIGLESDTHYVDQKIRRPLSSSTKNAGITPETPRTLLLGAICEQ